MATTKIELIFFLGTILVAKSIWEPKWESAQSIGTNVNNTRAYYSWSLLREKIYIDIGAHLYTIIVETTKTTSRVKLVLPSLIMRILHENGVETLKQS